MPSGHPSEWGSRPLGNFNQEVIVCPQCPRAWVKHFKPYFEAIKALCNAIKTFGLLPSRHFPLTFTTAKGSRGKIRIDPMQMWHHQWVSPIRTWNFALTNLQIIKQIDFTYLRINFSYFWIVFIHFKIEFCWRNRKYTRRDDAWWY